MINIQHLVDDTSDVMDVDTFAGLTAAAGPPYEHSQYMINARKPLPPGIYGDVVVLHFNASWSRLPFMSLLRQDMCNKPLILIEQTYTREFESRCVANRNRFRQLLRMTYRLADVVIASSEAQSAWLVEGGLLPPARVSTMSPPVDWAKFGTVAPPVNSEMPLRLAASGTLNYGNGFDILIEAMRRLPADLATLEIAGDGEECDALHAAARGIKGVCLNQKLVDPLSYLSRSDAVVVPSRWQPAAIQANQACAAARPLIATDVDTDAQVGVTPWGETVAADAPDDIAGAVVRLAGRSLSELGNAARASAIATMHNSQQQWSRILRTIAP